MRGLDCKENVPGVQILKVARCVVLTVRRMFQEFKLKTSDGLKYLVSRKCTGIIVLQNYRF